MSCSKVDRQIYERSGECVVVYYVQQDANRRQQRRRRRPQRVGDTRGDVFSA